MGDATKTEAIDDDSAADEAVDPKATDGAKSEGDGVDKKDDAEGLRKALAAERKQRAALEKAAKEAELAKLPELQRAQAEATELKAENSKLAAENMRMKVAMDLKMPWSLAKRLSGDTEEEIRTDAADVLKAFPQAASSTRMKEDSANRAKTTNDATKGGSNGKPGMNELLRGLAGR